MRPATSRDPRDSLRARVVVRAYLAHQVEVVFTSGILRQPPEGEDYRLGSPNCGAGRACKRLLDDISVRWGQGPPSFAGCAPFPSRAMFHAM